MFYIQDLWLNRKLRVVSMYYTVRRPELRKGGVRVGNAFLYVYILCFHRLPRTELPMDFSFAEEAQAADLNMLRNEFTGKL